MPSFPLLHGTPVGRIPNPEKRNERACKRCGVVAERRPTTTVCRDCLSVMSAAEKRLWGRAA